MGCGFKTSPTFWFYQHLSPVLALDHFGTTLQLLFDHSGTLRDRSGTTLQLLFDHSGITLEHSGITLGSLWNTLGSLWLEYISIVSSVIFLGM